MYRITCDGYSLLDTRDESLIVQNPKAKLSDNTVGEASFTIHTKHPHYDKLAMHKSRFEISDEFGVIFRGRMTEHTRDIKRGKAVDLEGAMAYFNDSIVRPYTFPEGFLNEEGYIAAAESGNVIEYYLAWLIEQHNAQVDEFQRFKLGTVTVKDQNNYLSRSNSEYPNTYAEIKSKLFDSSLGGHLCIRYETDGNYIDYLAEFTEKNAQGIVYGENLRSVSEVTDGKDAYSAIIPRGMQLGAASGGAGNAQLRMTIADLPDGDIDDDIVKKGDMLYSRSAVAAYGWRFAPASSTVWDDVTVATNLLRKGVEFLNGEATKIPKTIECKAVDLHCTDAEIRSFRIYKKIPVYIQPHGIDADFDLNTLDLDLLNPKNTNIVAGKTVITMTSIQDKQTSDVKQLAEKLGYTNQSVSQIQFATEKNKADIALVVSDGKADGSLLIEAINGETAAKISADRLDIEGKALDIKVDATNIQGDLAVGDLLNVDIDEQAVTIGGFTVAEDSLYAGEKTSYDDTGEGVYIGTDGIAAVRGTIGELAFSEYQINSKSSNLAFTADGLIVADKFEVKDDFLCADMKAEAIVGRAMGKTKLLFDTNLAAVAPVERTGTVTGNYDADSRTLTITCSAPLPTATTIHTQFYIGSRDTVMGWDLTMEAGATTATYQHIHWGANVEFQFLRPSTFTYIDYEDITETGIMCQGAFIPSADNRYLLGSSEYKWDQIYAKSDTILTSDRNEKNTITPLTDKHSDVFDKLLPVTYKLNNNTSDRLHIGLIAQDVKQALDDLGVNSKDFAAYCEWENKDGSFGCGLRYTELIAMTIYEIQKLKAKVKELEERK